MIYDALDYQRLNRLTLKQVYMLCKLVYRTNDRFQAKSFYNKLRFFFFFYQDKTLIRAEDLNPDARRLGLTAPLDDRLCRNSTVDAYWISRDDFFLIMTDLEALGLKDYFEHLFKCSEDAMIEDFNETFMYYCSERDKMSDAVNSALETSDEKKQAFHNLIRSTDSTLSNEVHTQRAMFAFLVRYHIALDMKNSILGLENKDFVDLVNISTSELTAKLHQESLL